MIRLDGGSGTLPPANGLVPSGVPKPLAWSHGRTVQLPEAAWPLCPLGLLKCSLGGIAQHVHLFRYPKGDAIRCNLGTALPLHNPSHTRGNDREYGERPL